jgi:type II secretory pathway pseudopilin PulG
VELLTAVVIIAVLISILVPSLVGVRNMAKSAAQKAQFMTIETGLLAFRNDIGDYPESSLSSAGDYCGAQRLAEAMLGADLMGFNPDSLWRVENGSLHDVYYPDTSTQQGIDNLKSRKGCYIDLEKAKAFRLGDSTNFGIGLFSNTGSNLAPEPYVLCDVYGVRKIDVGSKIVKAGTPILYYKANTSSKLLYDSSTPANSIYNVNDNAALIDLGILQSDGTSVNYVATESLSNTNKFYDYESKGGIKDSRMTATEWPHNPDSYILISAGLDGEYGTADDIRNFGN